MFKLLSAALFGLFVSIGAADAQQQLLHYLPSARTISGSQLNLMVDQVNGLTGNANQPAGNLVGTRLTLTKGGVLNRAINISSLPTVGNWNSVLTACNGDDSKVFIITCFQTTGVNTLTQPTSGYVYLQEAYPKSMFYYNNSGFNNSTSGNNGRTAAVGDYIKLGQAGQGDMVGHTVQCQLDTQTLAGYTNVLANPACVLFNGDAKAGADGQYLNLTEFDANDGGFDVAAAGSVINLSRSVNTGANKAFWYGIRVQSNGSTQADTAFSATGSGGYRFGLDVSNATLDANAAAITLSGNQRVYLNSTAGNLFPSAVGTTYFSYNSTDSSVELVVGGVQQLAISSTYVGVVNKTAINSGDRFGVAGSLTNNLGMTIDNSNVAVTATSILHFANNNSATQAAITLNGGNFSGGQGANALSISNASTAPIVLGTGTEVIKFGSSGAFTANGSTATAMSSVGPTGSHTTIQKWLTITDSGGTVGYIPVF
jgi:hypothetical protein